MHDMSALLACNVGIDLTGWLDFVLDGSFLIAYSGQLESCRATANPLSVYQCCRGTAQSRASDWLRRIVRGGGSRPNGDLFSGVLVEDCSFSDLCLDVS